MPNKLATNKGMPINAAAPVAILPAIMFKFGCFALVFLSHQIGSFFGAYLGGLFHDLYGSYDYAWYLAIALSVFAAIIHLPIKEEAVLRLKTE